MTLFERHLGRPMHPSEGIDEREFYVARLFTKKEMEKRWKKIGYKKPIAKQLEINF